MFVNQLGEPSKADTEGRRSLIATRYQQALAWGLLAAGLIASGAGSLWNLYSKIFWYDEVVHGYNFFALTLVVAIYAYGRVLTGADRHGMLLIFTIAGLGLGMGAIWEIAEWAYDQFVRPNAILPKTDTIIDLIVDTAGALAAGIVRLRMLRK